MIFIAEFCQNHNGDFELLKDMIYAAKESGADYAKIQNIFADMLSFRERFEGGLTSEGVTKVIKRPYQPEYNRLKMLELSYDQQAEFVEICNKVGIKPLTTTFNRMSIPRLKEIGFNEIKLASYDCGSLPLIQDVKKNFEKVFLSTGASYDTEIKAAAEVLKDHDFSLLHCVTIYPTPLNEYHLSRMEHLKQFTPSVGWSDHSLVSRDGILGTIASIYYGAEVIERHFTILDADQTKDGPVSVTPKNVKELKDISLLPKNDIKYYLEKNLHNFDQTWGIIDRELSHTELLNRDYYRGRFANKKANGEIYYNWEKK
ncbi:general stress protein [Flavobacteriaceae bacterium PRS1]|nr:general stress protein [Flavobacteriaceae bacterium PRS1]